MKSEYVGLSGSEKKYGERNLLHAQLELLEFIKSFKIYRLLRQEELLLKVGLKSKIGEVQEIMKKFERMLPKTSYKVESPGEKREKTKKRKQDLELQGEIEDVQEKLKALQGGK